MLQMIWNVVVLVPIHSLSPKAWKSFFSHSLKIVAYNSM